MNTTSAWARPHFTGARLTANVADNAGLLHCKLAFESQPSYHLPTTIWLSAATLGEKRQFPAGRRSDAPQHQRAQLNGEGANLVINSLVLPVGKEICDTRTYLEHNKGLLRKPPAA